MKKIQKVSSYLLIVFNMMLIAVPLFPLILWSFADTQMVKNLFDQGPLNGWVSTPEGQVSLSATNWTFLTKSIALIAHVLELLPLFLSLFVLKLIFKNYQKGEIFSTINANYYRRLGMVVFPICTTNEAT